MSLSNVTNGAFNIAGRLSADTASVAGRSEAFRQQIEKQARDIARREFMYQLRGENDIIDLESVATLRDRGAIELAKSA